MIPGSANPLLLASAAAAGGYQVSRSLRFNSADSAYLSRTPAVAGSRTTWTWAGWVKRSGFGSGEPRLFRAGSAGNESGISWGSGGDLYVNTYSGGSIFYIQTAQAFRDFSAWYHILVSYDSNNATASERVKIWVNGAQVTSFAASTYPSSGYQSFINSTSTHYLGWVSGGQYFDGYLADVHFIDGQALTPSSFTEVSATTGQLIPLAYSGAFGTNGFWLKFSDNSAATAAALGNDYSGNSNNWTPNNLSVTAGSGNDSLVDTPTSYGTDTGVGGSVRGNYCTWNPLSNGGQTLSNGNLDAQGPVSWATVLASFQLPATGKWYWEVTPTTANTIIGISVAGSSLGTYIGNLSMTSYGWYGDAGNKIQGPGGTQTSYASYAANDVIGVAYDADAGTLVFYKNGTSQGTAFSSLSGSFFPALSISGTSSAAVTNFGQRAFAYPLSGFKALCDTNLGAPVVAKPNTLMDVALYTGNGGTQTISGLAFEPDFVWLKGRSVAYSHQLYDQVRGAGKLLNSNSTSGESTVTDNLTAFTSAGFTLGNDAGTNQSSATYVGWAWDAGTSTVSNTAGSITSQVRANVSAGFSVVTFTAQSSGNATIGHGLGVEPHMIIVKSRADTYSWLVYHKALTSNAYYLILNSTAAQDNTSNAWNSTTPTSTVFTLGSTYAGGGNSVAYCFAPVVGYSSMGSYVGNGSADGPFVYTGFRPRWVMIKSSSAGGAYYDWVLYDTARMQYNVCLNPLAANLAENESYFANNYQIDLLSNGFKARNSSGNSTNTSSVTYIYIAFAENPFQYARAR